MTAIYAVRGGVLTLLVLNVYMTVVVLLNYRRAHVLSAAPIGLVPIHVLLVGSGNLLLQGGLAWGILEASFLSGGVATFTSIERMVVYGLGSLLVFVSLLIINKVQKLRMRIYREEHGEA